MWSVLKTKPLLWFAVVVVATILAVILVHPAGAARRWFQSQSQPDAYDFPVKPGTDQWRTLNSHAEMVEACQIPEDVLAAMSTEGLIETCLNYPLFGDMFFYNKVQQGFENVVSHFNGLQALLERPDAGSKLLALYREIDLGVLKRTDRYPALRLKYVEMLLAQDTILSSLTPSERQELLRMCLQRGRLKVDNYSDTYDYESTALLAGRILQMDNPEFAGMVQENAPLRAFLEDGSFVNGAPEDWDDIVQQIQQFSDSELRE